MLRKGRGLIQIYTGNGKGKTTAALGLAIRAVGHGLKIYYVYFHKNPDKWKYGEYGILSRLGIKTFGFAKKHPHFYRNADKNKIRQECLKALEFIKKIYQENKYDILILDEIFISLRDRFLKEKEILEILNLKPKNLELILTGRGATKRIIEKADLVSQIKNIKHPYNAGIRGRKGIEY
jgi:cob(I)alamin adenosyltransferase